MKRYLVAASLGLIQVILFGGAFAQKPTLADSLRGRLSPARTCFDVHYYHLSVQVVPDQKRIEGQNEMHFIVEEPTDSIQVDLFDNMQLDSIVWNGSQLPFRRVHHAVFVHFPKTLAVGANEQVVMYYQGEPIAAKNAPWDGGFVWKEDENGKPHIGVACEGIGASLWWPNKDHLSDEPDSMRISCTVPESLMCVANGDLTRTDERDSLTTYHWLVEHPINNYNVTLNIADYAHFSDSMMSASDQLLALDYYVLPKKLNKAKEHFKQVKPMMSCFEEAFGPYPFPKDGYALVETPYLGMEHQSAIAYGNQYSTGYLGRYPGEMDFDYIIIHETGHEWWGNSVSMKDAADMWIHESFCTYSEAVYVECIYGYESMLEYLLYQRNFISNRSPIQGEYGLNREGNSIDMYYKGSWMIHTLRNVIDNDTLFRAMIKELALEFRHRTVDGTDVRNFISDRVNMDLSAFFTQYLEYSDVPELQYRKERGGVSLRWATDVEGFAMPVVLGAEGGEEQRVQITDSEWTFVPMSRKQQKKLQFRDDLFLFLTKEQ